VILPVLKMDLIDASLLLDYIHKRIFILGIGIKVKTLTKVININFYVKVSSFDILNNVPKTFISIFHIFKFNSQLYGFTESQST